MIDKELRDKTKLIARDYDEALLAIETILGMAAEMALFIGLDVKNFVIVPKKVQYALAHTAMFMLIVQGNKENMGNLNQIDISGIKDFDKRFDIVFDYLEEIIKERKVNK